MKKLLLGTITTALVAVAAAPAVHAQSVHFGVKAGANLSNLAGDLISQDLYKNRFGFHGGAMVNVGLLADDFLAIQLEALYSQKGFNYADQEYSGLLGTYRTTGHVRYNYLDVPLLLRVKTNGIFFEAGPQYSYLFSIAASRTQSYNGNVLSTLTGGTSDLDRVKRNELGYAAGLGFQTEAGLLVGLRYNGTFNSYARDGYSNDEFRNARHSTFQAYVGFMLSSK
jgi:opacity protein-like surface antigen